MLIKEEIALLLELLAEETVVEPTKSFPYRVTRHAGGYSKDKKIGALQAKLSIMAEAASR
jgi:hypothetical protein